MKDIMRRAWAIARAAATIYGGKPVEYMRGGALKMAWAEAGGKPATKEQLIAALEAKGFRRWQKGRYDRLYINAWELGLACKYSKRGYEQDSAFQGASISNREARRMKAAKTYIDITKDVNEWMVVSDNDLLQEAAEQIMQVVAA